jgi:hypothetical protein
MAKVVENVVEADKEIVEAQEHQKSSGKMICIILTIVITVGAIITTIVLVKASKNK